MTMPNVSTTEQGMQRAAQEFHDKAAEFRALPTTLKEGVAP